MTTIRLITLQMPIQWFILQKMLGVGVTDILSVKSSMMPIGSASENQLKCHTISLQPECEVDAESRTRTQPMLSDGRTKLLHAQDSEDA